MSDKDDADAIARKWSALELEDVRLTEEVKNDDPLPQPDWWEALKSRYARVLEVCAVI
jgi:hypothetical protein